MLRRRVTSASELLDRKMLNKDDKKMHSLMNLVMQFRKVLTLNHESATYALNPFKSS